MQSRAKCATRKVRVCASGEVLSVQLPSRSWQLPLSGRETARRKILKTTNGGSVCQDNDSDLAVDVFRTSLFVQLEVEDSDVVIAIVDPTILCLATLQSASLAIDGPKMKNSITLGFLSMSRMKTMRNILASGNSTTPDVVGLLDPTCHVVLFVTFLECEVLLCLQLVEG